MLPQGKRCKIRLKKNTPPTFADGVFYFAITLKLAMAGNYTNPWATIAEATFTKPAMFAPAT